VYWFLGEMVYKDHHNNCLDNHKDYVLNNIVKPKLMSVIAYLSRVNYMVYEIIPYLQASTNEGETTRHVDYKALHSDADAKVLCRAQYNGLPCEGLSK
jgi:hypothetical protein